MNKSLVTTKDYKVYIQGCIQKVNLIDSKKLIFTSSMFLNKATTGFVLPLVQGAKFGIGLFHLFFNSQIHTFLKIFPPFSDSCRGALRWFCSHNWWHFSQFTEELVP